MVSKNLVCNECNSMFPKVLRQCIPIIPDEVFGRLVIDLIDFRKLFQENDNKKYIFTCIDSFSKYAWCFAIEGKTAESVNRCLIILLNQIPKPKLIQSDNEKEFSNNLIEDLLRENGIEFIHGAP